MTQYVWNTPDEQLGGMKALDELYDRNKPIDLNETGYYPLDSWYEGDKAGAVRAEAWEYFPFETRPERRLKTSRFSRPCRP